MCICRGAVVVEDEDEDPGESGSIWSNSSTSNLQQNSFLRIETNSFP